MNDITAQTFPRESERFNFVLERDGVEGLIDFAKQLKTQYRRACIARKHNGSKQWSRNHRVLMAGSYLDAKRLLEAV